MTNVLSILFILTSQATMGSGGAPTGVWFEELATPYYAFVDAGYNVDLASVSGGAIPIDPHSRHPSGKNPAAVERFLHDERAMAKLTASRPLAELTAAPYRAVFLPGGHGTMWDLPENAALAKLLSQAWAAGKIIAAVCHGPAGLVNVLDEHGQTLITGRRISAFTNSEEAAVGLTQTVPFALETRLREGGARYESGPDFLPYAVRDGRLITGQNPASSEAVAQQVLKALQESNAVPATQR